MLQDSLGQFHILNSNSNSHFILLRELVNQSMIFKVSIMHLYSHDLN